MEKQGHPFRSKISVPVANSVRSVDLGVSPEISDALDVDHDHFMARAFKREMTESLKNIKEPRKLFSIVQLYKVQFQQKISKI